MNVPMLIAKARRIFFLALALPLGLAQAIDYKAVFTSPPKNIPSDCSTDAPLLGNGSLLAALAGPPDELRFYVSRNDLWKLADMRGGKDPEQKPLGVVALSIPALKGASYTVEQDLNRAVTAGTFKKNGVTLRMESFVAAKRDLLCIHLSAEGGTLDGTVAANLPDGLAGKDSGDSSKSEQVGATQVVWRKFETDVRVKTGAAFAVRALGGGPAFSVSPGQDVWIVAASTSVFHDPDPKAAAVRAVDGLTAGSLKQALAEHEAWWGDFWSRSFVEIPDKALEQRYYLSQYLLGSVSRDPEFPPGLFGWITAEKSKWGGRYFLNYNFVAGFYGAYASNHIEQADPCSRPFVHVAERMAEDPSVRTPGTEGIYQCRQIAPLGICRDASRPFPGANGRSPEQKSNGAFSCVPLAMQWYATYDTGFAKRLYPYVKGVATFWEHWLKFENGQYNDYDDPIHEESGPDVNPLVSLALCRMVMDLAIDMSKSLNVDEDRREKWAHIRDHLAPYPTCTLRDLPLEFWPKHLPYNESTLSLPIFRYTEKGLPWNKGNTVGIGHIYPAGGIRLDSPQELLERSRNQIFVMDRWRDFNGMNSFYAAAARVGYDPNIILKELSGMVKSIGLPNGMIRNNLHGTEHLSIVPNAIQEMLMQSQGVIRFFPCWPKDQDARFGTLRARGAFLVSAEQKNGVVGGVTILSEKGRDCTVQNPWPGKAVRVTRNGKKAEKVSGERFTFKTKPGEAIKLQPAM